MRRSVPAVIACALLVAAGFAVGQPQAAADGVTPSARPSPSGVDTGSAEEKLANEQKLDWEGDFNGVANQLQAAHPDLFADARIVDDSWGYISFTTSIPAEAAGLVAAVPAPVELRVTGQRAEKDLVSALDTYTQIIWDDPETATVSGEISDDRRTLNFIVTPTADIVKAKTTSAFVGHVQGLVAASPIPTKITLREEDIPLQPQAALRGRR